MRLILFVGALILLSGCTSRTARIPPATPKSSANNDYIDIQAGWRLTAVTPILKSGGYVLKRLDQQTTGNSITLSETDFVGYEVAHYAVKGQTGGRVHVEFSSAEVTKGGETESQPRSIVPLFQLARRASYLRLIYLIRIGQADHNMAIIAASQLDALDALTRQVQANPADGCIANRHASCAWIPEGIAVRPEVLTTVGGIERWVDAPR